MGMRAAGCIIVAAATSICGCRTVAERAPHDESSIVGDRKGNNRLRPPVESRIEALHASNSVSCTACTRENSGVLVGQRVQGIRHRAGVESSDTLCGACGQEVLCARRVSDPLDHAGNENETASGLLGVDRPVLTMPGNSRSTIARTHALDGLLATLGAARIIERPEHHSRPAAGAPRARPMEPSRCLSRPRVQETTFLWRCAS